MSTVPSDNNSDSKDLPPSTDGNSGGSRGGDLKTETSPDSTSTPPEPEAASLNKQKVISSTDAMQ